MRSIGQTISSRLLIGGGAVLIATGTVLGLAIHARLVAELDHTLDTKMRALAALTSVEGPFIEFDFTPAQMPEFAVGDRPEYFELRLRDGRRLARSSSLGDAELPPLDNANRNPAYRNVTLPDGRHGRLARSLLPVRIEDEGAEISGLEPDDEDEESIHTTNETDTERVVLAFMVARGREDLDRLLLTIYGLLAGIVVLILLSLAMVARHAVRRGLVPLAAINEQVGAIGPAGLQQRVRLPDPPTELRTIVAAVNGLLERLEAAFARERRFSSDVAHELRTPVAELRAACEVGGRWPDNPDATRQFFSDIREIATQMEGIVSNLLMLARCDDGTASLAEDSVPLEPLVRACGERALNATGASGDVFEFSFVAGATIRTDRSKVEMIVQNLLDNAVAHRAPGTPVRCRLEAHGPQLELRVENQVHSLDPADIAHMRERFWRKDEARTGGAHAGLGLSIAHELCGLLGLELRIALRDNRVLCAHVTFPARPESG